jgi:hypothetical protein
MARRLDRVIAFPHSETGLHLTKKEAHMPIYVNTNNSDPKKKVFIARALGKSAFEAEKIMKEGVEEAVKGAPDFTTAQSKDAKGYTIKLEVKAQAGTGGQTTVSLKIEIETYPAAKIVPMTFKSGTITSSGGPEKVPLDDLKELVNGAVKKALPQLRVSKW